MFLDGMPCFTPLNVDFISNNAEKYHLIANVCSHIIRTRLQYDIGDGAMESDKRKIIELLENANEKQLKIILEELRNLIKTFT
ncbi:MAG: hypothetical protein JWM44_1554 [Bacilli bacterium]|nr:hypothetical protein [Bacilli bacterium]